MTKRPKDLKSQDFRCLLSFSHTVRWHQEFKFKSISQFRGQTEKTVHYGRQTVHHAPNQENFYFFADCWYLVQRLFSNWEISTTLHMPLSAVHVKLWIYWKTKDTRIHALMTYAIRHIQIQIRTLLAKTLTACCSLSPTEWWEKYKSHMAEDIFHWICKKNSNMKIYFTAKIYNEALIMTEDLSLKIANNVLNQLGMPSRNRSIAASF